MIKEIFERFKKNKCDSCTKDRECSIHLVKYKGKLGAKCEDQEYFGGGNDGK